MTDNPRFHSKLQPVELGAKPSDADWIETYITGANKPLDFGPVKRHIRNHKLATIEAETQRSDQTVIKIAAQAAPFIALPAVRDPWEAIVDDV